MGAAPHFVIQRKTVMAMDFPGRVCHVQDCWVNFKGSAAAADPLVGQVPLVVDMTLRWGDMTFREEILGGQNSGSWGFSGPGTFKKRFPVKNDVE